MKATRAGGWRLEAALTALVVLLALLSLMTGPAGLSPADAIAGLVRGEGTAGIVVRDIRLPRTALALLIGATLGLSGAALQGLLQMDAAKALPVLKKVLARRDSGSVCLRRRAVFIVSQQGTNAEPILLEVARTDPDAEVRGQAVFWLSQVDSPAALSALDSILKSSRDLELQDKAIFAISQQDSPRRWSTC